MKLHQVLALTFLAVSACDSSDTGQGLVARVNSQPITVTQFQNEARRIAEMPGKDINAMARKKELLSELVDQELLFQAALKENFIEENSDLRRRIARSYLTAKVGQQTYEPSADEIQAFFEKNREELERVNANHILIKPAKSGDKAAENAALERAKMVLKQLREGKITFAKAAKMHSDDPSNKDSGGNLGFFTRKKMVPEFSAAAFALKKEGDVSDIVKTQYGYHIIQLVGEQRGLERFKGVAKAALQNEKAEERFHSLIAKLRDSAKIDTYENELSKIEIVTNRTGEAKP